MNEYYGITYASDSLSHHGVKGMHWGVRKMTDRRHQEHKAKRRYQNPDGSLKPKGVARIVNSGSYLDPSRKGKDKRYTKHRKAIADQYIREFNNRIPEKHRDNGYMDDTMDEIWNKYKTPYASATLRDLRLKDSKKARRDVNKVFRDTMVGFDTNYYDRTMLWNPEQVERYEAKLEKRREELAHPTKTKIKKAGKKVGKAIKSGLSTAVTIKSLLK